MFFFFFFAKNIKVIRYLSYLLLSWPSSIGISFCLSLKINVEIRHTHTEETEHLDDRISLQHIPRLFRFNIISHPLFPLTWTVFYSSSSCFSSSCSSSSIPNVSHFNFSPVSLTLLSPSSTLSSDFLFTSPSFSFTYLLFFSSFPCLSFPSVVSLQSINFSFHIIIFSCALSHTFLSTLISLSSFPVAFSWIYFFSCNDWMII